MRIAYVCADPGVPVFGNKGCSIHVQEIVRAMIATGAEVELFVARQGGTAPPGLEACRVHEMPVPKCAETRDREVEQVLWNQRVVEALKQRPSFDLLYERHSLWSASALRWAKDQDVPSVLEVNAPLIEEQSEHRQLVQRNLAHGITRHAMRSASVTYAVSDEIVPYCQQFLETSQRAEVIPNGVNTSRFSPVVTPAVESGLFTIGFVGTLKPWHGLDDLLEAFALLSDSRGTKYRARKKCLTPFVRSTRRAGSRQKGSDTYFPPIPNSQSRTDCQLLIVGEGPQRSAIETWLEKRSCLRERVHLTGGVDAEDVPGWLTAMDVAVVPYPNLPHCYFSPLKIFEYMAAGRPIVASATGQVREVIQNGVNGLLYPPGDIDRLAKSLHDLRENISLRIALGRAARASALSRDWQHVVEKIFSFAGIRSTEDALDYFSSPSREQHDEIQA